MQIAKFDAFSVGNHRGFFREPRLSLAQQRAQMMRVWPMLDSRVEHGQLVVTGVVKPTPITRSYRIRLTLKDRGAPQVHVLSPMLTRRPQDPETPIPHTYGYDTPGKEQPCLYYWKGGEWKPKVPVALSLMPWLLSWLLDYEYWFATGDWLGGGMPHGSMKTRDDSQRASDANGRA